jgi:hypothetical protein
MCSIHDPASACGRLVAFGFCAPSSPFGHSSALSLPGSVLHTSTFLPTFPPPGFASRASCGSSPQRYYEGSDSCRSLARPAGLSAYSAPPSERPDPNHVMCPKRRFVSHLSAFGRDPKAPRFRRPSRARRHTPPKQVRHPTGYSFVSSCFPPRLTATQLPSTSCGVTPHDRDSHPADRTSSRTHEGRAPARPQPALGGREATPPRGFRKDFACAVIRAATARSRLHGMVAKPQRLRSAAKAIEMGEGGLAPDPEGDDAFRIRPRAGRRDGAAAI